MGISEWQLQEVLTKNLRFTYNKSEDCLVYLVRENDLWKVTKALKELLDNSNGKIYWD